MYYLKPEENKGRKKNDIVLYVSDKYGEQFLDEKLLPNLFLFYSHILTIIMPYLCLVGIVHSYSQSFIY